MAVPIQYQSQFIPTDFSTVGNLLGMFRQDMAQRNQEFDEGVALENAASELYGTKTYDQNLVNTEVDKLKSKIEDVVKVHGMDYGAAAKQIAGIIGKERSNPFWKLNERKVEQAKMLEEMLARNPNLKVLRDPKKVDLTQKGLNIEDIGYGVLDPEDYMKALAIQTKGLDSKTTPLGIKNVNGYDMFQTQVGLSEKEVNERLTPEQFQQSLTGLGNYNEIINNPQLMNELYGSYSNYIKGLNQGIKQTEGMTPYQKFSMEMARREYADKQSALKGTGPIPVGSRPMSIKSEFTSASSIIDALTNDKTEKFKQNQANDYLTRILERGNIKIPEKYLKDIGDKNIIKHIEDLINLAETSSSSSASEFAKLSERSSAYAPASYRENIISKAKEVKKDFTPEKLRELKQIKSSIEDALELDLKLQGSDGYIDMYAVNPADKKRADVFKDYSSLISPENFVFLTGENLKGLDKKKIQGSKDFEDVQKGFDIIGAGTSLNEGNVMMIRTKTGKEYLVKHDNPEVSNHLVSIIDPDMAAIGAANDLYEFSGNIMKNKYTGQEAQLPFDVSYSSEKSPSGATKKYYSIKGLKAFDYYKDDIQTMEDKMDANGWSNEQKTQFFLTNYPQVFELKKGNLEVKDENFKTLLIQDIINYATKLQQ